MARAESTIDEQNASTMACVARRLPSMTPPASPGMGRSQARTRSMLKKKGRSSVGGRRSSTGPSVTASRALRSGASRMEVSTGLSSGSPGETRILKPKFCAAALARATSWAVKGSLPRRSVAVKPAEATMT